MLADDETIREFVCIRILRVFVLSLSLAPCKSDEVNALGSLGGSRGSIRPGPAYHLVLGM